MKKFALFLFLLLSCTQTSEYSNLNKGSVEAIIAGIDKSIDIIDEIGLKSVFVLLAKPIAILANAGIDKIDSLTSSSKFNKALHAINNKDVSCLNASLFENNKDLENKKPCFNLNKEISSTNKMTLLHLAVQKSCHPAIRILIQSGSNLNAVDTNGMTPLHYAALSGFSNITQLLLESSDPSNFSNKSDPNTLDNQRMSPLHYAALKGYLDVCNALVEGGSKSTHGDEDLTPLHLAALLGRLDICRVIVDSQGEGAVDVTDRYGRTPLHMSALSGNHNTFNYLIEKLSGDNGDKVQPKTHRGATPLHYAAWGVVKEIRKCNKPLPINAIISDIPDISEDAGYNKIQKKVIEASGKNAMNSKDNYGWTPIHYSLMTDNLISMGLDDSGISNLISTEDVIYPSLGTSINLIEMAVCFESYESLRMLLRSACLNNYAVHNRPLPPLIIAARNGSGSVCRILLDDILYKAQEVDEGYSTNDENISNSAKENLEKKDNKFDEDSTLASIKKGHLHTFNMLAFARHSSLNLVPLSDLKDNSGMTIDSLLADATGSINGKISQPNYQKYWTIRQHLTPRKRGAEFVNAVSGFVTNNNTNILSYFTTFDPIDSWSVFGWMIVNNEITIIEKLIEIYPEILDKPAGQYGTPTATIDCSPMYVAVRENIKDVILYIASKGKSVWKGENGDSSMAHTAAKYDASESIEAIRITLGSNEIFDSLDSENKNPLTIACEKGNLKVIDSLTRMGLRCAAPIEGRSGPLHFAVSQKKYKKILEHLSQCPDIEVALLGKNSDSKLPLQLAAENHVGAISANALMGINNPDSMKKIVCRSIAESILSITERKEQSYNANEYISDLILSGMVRLDIPILSSNKSKSLLDCLLDTEKYKVIESIFQKHPLSLVNCISADENGLLIDKIVCKLPLDTVKKFYGVLDARQFFNERAKYKKKVFSKVQRDLWIKTVRRETSKVEWIRAAFSK